MLHEADSAERPEIADIVDRSDREGIIHEADRADSAERPERTELVDRVDRAEIADSAERPEQTGQTE